MFKFENDEKFAQALKDLMEKYKDDFALLAKDSFLQEAGILVDKYEGNRTSAEFYRDYHALRLQHAPNLANFDKEMQELQEEYKKTNPAKYKQMEEWGPESENGKKLQEGLSVIREKYKDDLALIESKKFQKAVEKLDEKYDKSSSEYHEAFLALRLEYAPNLVDFDKEVQELQTSLGMPDFNNVDTKS